MFLFCLASLGCRNKILVSGFSIGSWCVLVGLVVKTRVGRKGAIYLPRRLLERLGVSEGDQVLLRVENGKVILEFIPDPFLLAVKQKPWSETTVEEFERESEREQAEWNAESTS